MRRARDRSYVGLDGEEHCVSETIVMTLPAPAALRRMDGPALLAWCQRDTWRRLGGHGGCPWVGERDGPSAPPKAPATFAELNHKLWKAERAAYMRLFAPVRGINGVQPWAGGEHVHKCPSCVVQPRHESLGYHGKRELALAFAGYWDDGIWQPSRHAWPGEAPYWWCDVPDADCPHGYEALCEEHDPESEGNQRERARREEDAAHEAAGGDGLEEHDDVL